MTAMSPNFHVQTFAMIFLSIQLVAGTCMFQEEQVTCSTFPEASHQCRASGAAAGVLILSVHHPFCLSSFLSFLSFLVADAHAVLKAPVAAYPKFCYQLGSSLLIRS
jgi:hypothetical protein